MQKHEISTALYVLPAVTELLMFVNVLTHVIWITKTVSMNFRLAKTINSTPVCKTRKPPGTLEIPGTHPEHPGTPCNPPEPPRIPPEPP